MLPFKITQKYARGPEKLVAKFDNQDEAREYIQGKLAKDKALRVNVIYSLYDQLELLEAFDQDNANSKEEAQGSQQQSSTQSFRPSPLQTIPRPSGMPPSSFKNDNDEKKK